MNYFYRSDRTAEINASESSEEILKKIRDLRDIEPVKIVAKEIYSAKDGKFDVEVLDRIYNTIDLLRKNKRPISIEVNLDLGKAHLYLTGDSSEYKVLKMFDKMVTKDFRGRVVYHAFEPSETYPDDNLDRKKQNQNLNDIKDGANFVNAIAKKANSFQIPNEDGSFRQPTVVEKLGFIYGNIINEIQVKDKLSKRYMRSINEYKKFDIHKNRFGYNTSSSEVIMSEGYDVSFLHNWIGAALYKKALSDGFASVFQTVCEATFGPNSKKVLCLYQPIALLEKNGVDRMVENKHANNLVLINDLESKTAGCFWMDGFMDVHNAKRNVARNFSNFLVPLSQINARQSNIYFEEPNYAHAQQGCIILQKSKVAAGNEEILAFVDDDISPKTKDNLRQFEKQLQNLETKKSDTIKSAKAKLQTIYDELLKDQRIREIAQKDYMWIPRAKMLRGPRYPKEAIEYIHNFGKDDKHADIEELKKSIYSLDDYMIEKDGWSSSSGRLQQRYGEAGSVAQMMDYSYTDRCTKEIDDAIAQCEEDYEESKYNSFVEGIENIEKQKDGKTDFINEGVLKSIAMGMEIDPSSQDYKNFKEQFLSTQSKEPFYGVSPPRSKEDDKFFRTGKPSLSDRIVGGITRGMIESAKE